MLYFNSGIFPAGKKKKGGSSLLLFSSIPSVEEESNETLWGQYFTQGCIFFFLEHTSTGHLRNNGCYN